MRVIACGGRKLPHPAPARELYTGPLFRAARAWAEQSPGGRWFILSAHHGLVHPDTVVEPYDVYVTKDKRHLEWAVGKIGAALQGTVPAHLDRPETAVTVAAPLRYYLALSRYSDMSVSWAFEDLTQTRMGFQLQWLRNNTERG